MEQELRRVSNSQINELEDLSPIHKLSKKIITESFDEFKNKKFSEIYQKYPESKKEINESFNFIKTLNPKPSGGMEDSSITEYLIPDFIIKNNDEFLVELAFGGKPININKSYITIYDDLKRKKNKDSSSKESLEFIKKKLKRLNGL